MFVFEMPGRIQMTTCVLKLPAFKDMVVVVRDSGLVLLARKWKLLGSLFIRLISLILPHHQLKQMHALSSS